MRRGRSIDEPEGSAPDGVVRRRDVAALLAVYAANAAAGLACGVPWVQVGLGTVIGAVFAWQSAVSLRKGRIHTLQDGNVSARDQPIRFWGVMLILAGGAVGGALYVWS